MWEVVSVGLAGGALVVSVVALVRGERRAERGERRLEKIEHREAVALEIVELGGSSFEGFPLLGIAVNGSETVGGLQIDPASVTDVGLGGATTFIDGESGAILRQFWIREADRRRWPDTIRLTFSTPFEDSRVVRLPRPRLAETDH